MSFASPSSSPSDLATLLRVAHFAALAHQHQRRKSPAAPAYIEHPLDVARRIASSPSSLADGPAPVPIDLLCAALCHDVLEDTDVTEAELRQQVGDRVTEIGKAPSRTAKKHLQALTILLRFT